MDREPTNIQTNKRERENIFKGKSITDTDTKMREIKNKQAKQQLHTKKERKKKESRKERKKGQDTVVLWSNSSCIRSEG